MTDQNAIASDEMRERIKTLRNKAELARKSAEFDETQAAKAREDAAKCDEVADQYEAILRLSVNRMRVERETLTSGDFGVSITTYRPGGPTLHNLDDVAAELGVDLDE